MVAYDDDVDAAMEVHLLQAVHQLTDDLVYVHEGFKQLQKKLGEKNTHTHSGGGKTIIIM